MIRLKIHLSSSATFVLGCHRVVLSSDLVSEILARHFLGAVLLQKLLELLGVPLLIVTVTEEPVWDVGQVLDDPVGLSRRSLEPIQMKTIRGPGPDSETFFRVFSMKLSRMT